MGELIPFPKKPGKVPEKVTNFPEREKTLRNGEQALIIEPVIVRFGKGMLLAVPEKVPTAPSPERIQEVSKPAWETTLYLLDPKQGLFTTLNYDSNPTAYVGRHPENDFMLPESTVSRDHAVFSARPDGEGFILIDRRSTNGTRIQPIEGLTEGQHPITIPPNETLVFQMPDEEVQIRFGNESLFLEKGEEGITLRGSRGGRMELKNTGVSIGRKNDNVIRIPRLGVADHQLNLWTFGDTIAAFERDEQGRTQVGRTSSFPEEPGRYSQPEIRHSRDVAARIKDVRQKLSEFIRGDDAAPFDAQPTGEWPVLYPSEDSKDENKE